VSTISTVVEGGLYSLIMVSRKPEAKAFKRWVVQEVLPSIRKTGSYSAAILNVNDN
jgi:anti-repressor protein